MPNYHVYIDDSGHPDDQPYVMVAGFVASESQWILFEPAWQNALLRNGLEQPFHMTDFMAIKRPLKEQTRILADLTAVIHGHTDACFVGGVEMSGYKRVNDDYALEECLGTPYALACRALAIELNRWREDTLKPKDQLLIFAESGTKDHGDMSEVFKRDNLPQPVFVPKDCAAVQPADMLAWEIFHNFTKGRNIGRRRIKRLARGKKKFGMVFSEKDLREMSTVSDKPYVIPRSSLATTTKIAFHSSPKRPRRRTIH